MENPRRQLPEEFLRLIDSYGSPELEGLKDALSGEPCVSIRFNPRKSPAPPENEFPKVPWCENGVYLPERPSFTMDPSFHQGCYYVQDASSMIVHHIAKQLTQGRAPGAKPLFVLDACAAPGGKTTALADALPYGSVIVANEFSPQRASVLRENTAKWGYPFIRVTNDDAVRFGKYRGLFDMILVDAPCSGEGMMRKDPVAVEQWSPNLVRQCAARQKDIVASLWEAVAPGGYMIYSTCTFNRAENEEIARYVVDGLGGESVKIEINPSWGIARGIDTEIECLRFLPGKVKGEGLFVSVFRKSTEESSVTFPNKLRGSKENRPMIPSVKNWLQTDRPVKFLTDAKGNVFAEFQFDTLPEELSPRLKIGQMKGKDIVPAQELAMSSLFNPEAFPTEDVSRNVAIDYLRGEALRLNGNLPRGHILLTFGGRPLGFVKNIGTRANNLYPDSWRIRKS